MGRRNELASIEQVIETARYGRSGVLVVRGVAGVGKTALLDAASGAAVGFRVLRAEGVEAESELAFAGLHQLLRPLEPLFSRLPLPQRTALEGVFGLGAGADRFVVAASVLALLAEAAEAQPLLCVVDDFQWLDRPSAEALGFVARRLDAEPIALLLALRDTVPAGLARFEVLALSGLDRADARAVLDRAGRLAPADRERVLDAAEGIPLALLELPRGPEAEMGTVERAFADRVSALPEASRTALLLAAADDDPEGRTALHALAGEEVRGGGGATGGGATGGAPASPGVSVGAFGPAEAAGLVRLVDGRVVFRHPLVRSAVYGAATFEQRRDAHERLGGALTASADADRRAWHLAGAVAAPDAAVAAELERSADRARARGGYAAAAATLERAAQLTADDAPRARRLVAAADAARFAGDVGHAEALAGEVLRLMADPVSVAHATAIRGAIRAHRGELEAGEEDLRAAAHALAPAQPRLALRIAALAAETGALAGRHEAAIANARWAASLPGGDAAPDRSVVAFINGVALILSHDPGGAREPFADALDLAGDDPQLITWAAIGAIYTGDLLGGRKALTRAIAVARDRGAIGDVAFALQVLANVELLEGRFAVAATDASDGLALALESGEEAAAAHCQVLLAWLAAVRGDPDDARATAQMAQLAGDRGAAGTATTGATAQLADVPGATRDATTRAPAQLGDIAGAARAVATRATAQPSRLAGESAHRALALLDLADGRFEEAFDRLHAQFSAPAAHPARRLFLVGDLVEAAVGCDRDATAAYDELHTWAVKSGSAWWTALAATARVQLEGEAAYDDAVKAHTHIALPFERGRLELRMGEVLRRARRRTDSRRHLRAALDLFAQLGATPWERRAAAELRATGETARKRDASTLDDLTPQELQIARMVAEGATNRDIAGRLFISPRTVDYHLRKVFQKLNVTSRTQLAMLDR
ncbi:LuxR C-terminal-related transcriptional regulator [Solirubrobacter ginsenosidimutans]|uniref:LuxR C-terminal-related transcriptional regulator n=1 Tax=Solirubrobacter ginsenosidimutans TaxID=490573 RepID=A0A9X3S010_9ACTN|nr:LuxR C-terminal-related transcriptional regulator [Solirubrobacter ginsenosidimutans]